MSETSAFGTFRTWRDVRLESVMRTKADVRQRLWFGFTPQRNMRDEYQRAFKNRGRPNSQRVRYRALSD
jgi:hypothetical protein